MVGYDNVLKKYVTLLPVVLVNDQLAKLDTIGYLPVMFQMKKPHIDKIPHRCSDCGKRFEILASLITHIDVHTCKRPHECKYCEGSYLR